MPVPQDPDQRPFEPFKAQGPPDFNVNMRRPSEESIRTEDCDGPALDTSMEKAEMVQERDGDAGKSGEALCSDRAELIERIKRGESPTWVPNKAVSRTWAG